MGPKITPRLLSESPLEGEVAASAAAGGRVRRVRSVTVNAAESPLGWLLSRGLVSPRQYEAGERLRADWERAQLAPKVTMAWNVAAQGRRGRRAAPEHDLTSRQIDARRRFDAAVASARPGLSDILWRVVCAGDGMREAETALGWPARAGKLVLTLALARIREHYPLP